MKKLLIALVTLLVFATATSCVLFEDKAMTTSDNVTPEGQEHMIPVDLNLIPINIREQFEAAGKILVLVDKGYIMEPEKAVDVEDPDPIGWVDFGLGVAKTVFPGVAGLEMLSLLFSKRKRKHYGIAIAKATPINGSIELKEAITSLARAWGLAHSSNGTKEVFEEEAKKSKAA
jgi:hypothetical protein